MKLIKGKKPRLLAALVGILALLVTIPASAAVWTDKPDYQPGETVTISGARDDTNPYIPGETVEVIVTGPNDYLQQCLSPDGQPVIVAADGTWSCQVVLYPDERAFGGYVYTADGLSSLVHEEGTFTDYDEYYTTKLVNLRPTSGGYGADISVQATLVFQHCDYESLPPWEFPVWFCEWLPLTGSTVEFSLGTLTGSGVADSNGVATASIAAPLVDAELTAVYGGESWCAFGDCEVLYPSSSTILFHSISSNTAPVLTVDANTIWFDEGDLAVNTGTVTDADGDPVTLTTTDGVVTNNGDGTWSWSRASCYGSGATQMVTVDADMVTIYADDGNGGTDQFIFWVFFSNVPPVISAITSPIEPIRIDQPINISTTFTDADTCDTHEADIDWGDGSNETIHSYTSGLSVPHTYMNPGVYHVGVTISDDYGASDFEYAEWVVVYDPNAGFVTGGGWFEYQSMPSFEGSFYEVVEAAQIPWEEANQAAQASQLFVCADSHLATITSPEEENALWAFFGGGVLKDKWLGGYQTEDEDYDDGWKWITGEAWDWTHWGWGEPNDYYGPHSEQFLMYKEDGTWNDGLEAIASGYIVEHHECLTSGKATFGFVSKYQKGAGVPTGNTEFQFHDADLNFHSTSYEWLLVTGSNYAKFKGEGTINGEGTYKFMVWAGDGTAPNGMDTFRIKIWTEEGGVETVIYDNLMEQEISEGDIVVHSN